LEDRFAIMGRTDMVTSANRVALPLRSLRDKPFIAMSRETGIRRSLESQLGPLEHHFSVKYEVSQLASVLGLVEEGIGWSLIPQLALSPFVSQAVSIIYPKNPLLMRSLGIVQRADRPLSPAALAVVQTIVEINQTTQFFPSPRSLRPRGAARGS
jgi:DNA-binding transcriptional LysR family regulator